MPLLEGATVPKILSDPKNCLGDDFNPDSDYGLYESPSELLTRRLSEGGIIVGDNIPGPSGHTMVLVEFPKETK